MDYSYYSANQQQYPYNSLSHEVPAIYGLQDGPINGEPDLLRGLTGVGNNYDAYSQFAPRNHFDAPLQQNSLRAQQQSQPQRRRVNQSLQAPKSLSPELSREGSAPRHAEDGSSIEARNLSGTFTKADTSQEPTRSSDDEKDMNSMPIQDKRKAQNRAAQRAFRERKEKHVKELEAKLNSLSNASNNLQSDNERLKRELAALSTQNEILRATHPTPPSSSSSRASFHNPPSYPMPRPPSPAMGPQIFSPTEFVVATGGTAAAPLRFDAYPNPRGRMLLAGAAWDLIVRDPRVNQGRVDLQEVCKRLAGKAICDGRGPAFTEELVRQSLDECSFGDTGDDLL